MSESLEPRTWPTRPDATGVTRWVGGAEVMKINVDGDRCLLFNPVGSSGAAVLDGPALDVFKRFSLACDLSRS